MIRQCLAPGCTAFATRYGAHCSTHKTRKRRHGAPDQRGVTRADLKPFLTQVQARIARNQGLTIWGLLDKRWTGLVVYTEEHQSGIRSRWVHHAAQEMQRLALMVQPRQAVETTLAMYLMREQAGHRFRSDAAFNTQLVRRLRGLTEANARFSASAGRVTRAYSEASPRVTAIMSGWIVGTLGMAGLWFARQEKTSADERAGERSRLHDGLLQIDFT